MTSRLPLWRRLRRRSLSKKRRCAGCGVVGRRKMTEFIQMSRAEWLSCRDETRPRWPPSRGTSTWFVPKSYALCAECVKIDWRDELVPRFPNNPWNWKRMGHIKD